MRTVLSITTSQAKLLRRAIKTFLEDGSGSDDHGAHRAAEALIRQLSGEYASAEREHIYRSAVSLSKSTPNRLREQKDNAGKEKE